MKLLSIKGTEIPARVDDEDYENLLRFKWKFTINSSGYKRIYRNVMSSTRLMNLSNQIMMNSKVMFDHKDRDIFNNQKENLREADLFDNAQNKEKYKGKYSSQYKGVNYSPNRTSPNKWRTYISIDGKQNFIGYYSTELEAAKVYNDAAIKHHGEFACLNVLP